VKDRLWVGDMLGDEAETIHTEYVKRYQSISYLFAKEVEDLFKNISQPSDLCKTKTGDYPYILKMYMQGEISLETLCILDRYLCFSPRFNKKFGTDDIVWGRIGMLMIKFKPFLKYDKIKIKKILKEKINDRFPDQIDQESTTTLQQTA